MRGKQLYNGRYTIKEEIGSGGFAKIYQASEVDNPVDVAIKVATDANNPTFRKSLREEARLIQAFNHKNIVQLHPIPRTDKKGIIFSANAIGLPGNPTFFVMEYLSGDTLNNYLEGVKQLTIKEAAFIAWEIATALEHMHQQSYAHNDLKLENIVFRQPLIVGQPFEPVLIDFGIASRVQEPDAGSFYIMPPEQVAKVKMSTPPEVSQQLDRKKGDVWSLGVVLYRMLGGKLPFLGRNTRSLTQQIFHSTPIPLTHLSPEIPPEINYLILNRCLAKDPNQRIGLRELMNELYRLTGGYVVLVETEPKPSKGWSGWWPFSR